MLLKIVLISAFISSFTSSFYLKEANVFECQKDDNQNKHLISNETKINSPLELNIFPDYYAFTNFNMENYFNHLYDYSPHNEFGSCSIVSLIQIMTYYDTFYNDNIVSNDFDKYSNNITTLNQAYQIAPGVQRFNYNLPSIMVDGEPEVDPYALYNRVYDSLYTDYQCYLLYLANLINNTNNSSQFQSGIYYGQYQQLLDELYGYNQVLAWQYTGYSTQYYFQVIKSFIDYNHPVIVDIADNDEENLHAVVAYDYDDNNIYANYGWGSSDTHLPLLNGDYSKIRNVTFFDFHNLGHLHSNNYYINGVGYCGCNPNNIGI